MTVPDSVDAKLKWARKHMDAAKRSVDVFVDGHPYAVGRELEDEGARHVYRFTRYSEPPTEIGLKVGDTIHNLRSSLDHLALALARKGAEAEGVTMTLKEETRVQFPIASTPDNYKDQIGSGRLKNVDASAVEQISWLQPYRQGDNFATAPLWCIRELDDADKHRKLATLGCVVRDLSSITLPPGVPEPESTFPREGWGLGAVVVAYVFPAPYPEVDMHFEPTFAVALEEAWPPTRPIYDVLRDYIEYVEEYVVGSLAERFL